MAIRGSFIPPRQSKALAVFNGGAGLHKTPFDVTSLNQNIISVEKYSCLLEHLDVKTNIPILGLNYGFKIQYGEKIYLETVFDVNGHVAYARIDNSPCWKIKISGAADNTSGILVYPDLIACLSKSDRAYYTDFMSDQNIKVTKQQTADLAFWQTQIDNAPNQTGTIYLLAKAAHDEHKTNYTNALKKITDMQKSDYITNFFGLNMQIRRQVVSYNVIAHTTKNPQARNHLSAFSVIPPGIDLPSGQTVDSEDFMKSALFYVVQDLTKDVMLMDVDFRRTACRYPIEFSRPIYSFINPTTLKIEDDEQIDPANLPPSPTQ